MSLLKQLLDKDFLSTEKDGKKEVIMKKEPDYLDGEKDFICIRKDYLLLLDDHFDGMYKKLQKYEEIFNKIKDFMEETDEQ